jgi:pimeloyl-ACP methyl ester carboxylesterase
MTFEDMAADVAGLIKWLGFGKADLMGYSLGGGVALRAAIDHPEVVDRLVLVATPFAFAGWHDESQQAMKTLGAVLAEPAKATPMYQLYARLAPDADNWPKLFEQVGRFIGEDYDWSSEIASIKAATLLVVGDWDSVRASHTVQFFELLGGGRHDVGPDGSGMNRSRLAILPGATHRSIFTDPKLAQVAIAFLDGSEHVAPETNAYSGVLGTDGIQMPALAAGTSTGKDPK